MDPRPLKLLERAPDAHREDLVQLAKHAGKIASDAGTELQFEFGKHHIAYIVGCNQFLRLIFRGDHAGDVELPPDAGVDGEAPLESVFRMFGWARAAADPTLLPAVDKAFNAARAKGSPKLTG